MERKLPPYHEAIPAQVAARPDAILAELCAWLSATHGIGSSQAGMWNTLARLGLRLKKTSLAAEQEPPDTAAERAAWCALQPTLSPERLVFLDETWATSNMVSNGEQRQKAQ